MANTSLSQIEKTVDRFIKTLPKDRFVNFCKVVEIIRTIDAELYMLELKIGIVLLLLVDIITLVIHNQFFLVCIYL